MRTDYDEDFRLYPVYLISHDNGSLNPCIITDFYREKAEQLERLLESERKKARAQKEHNEHKEKKLTMLEQQLKAQERKYKDELKAHTQTMNKLKHELDSKGNTIAYLTSQIHTSRRAVVKDKGQDESRPHSSSSEDRDSVRYSPAPPKDGAPKHRRRLSSKSSLTESQAQGLLATSVRHRAASSRKMSDQLEFDLDENVPDPTPFLQAQTRTRSSAGIKRTERKPLPPIGLASNDGKIAMGEDGTAEPLVPQQTHSYTFVRKHHHRNKDHVVSSSPEVEVESLAVDQADDLRRAQEFKSTSTDCN